MAAKSVVDIGMEILRAEGALVEPVVDPQIEPVEEPPSELDVMQGLVTQLQTLTDRLSLAETVRVMTEQLSALTALVQNLSVLVTQPRVKVPVRDEAGRIVQVREVVQPLDGSHGE